MLTDGIAVVSKVSSKFVHEVLPVALASVIGTLIVNHYGGPIATPVVVQANPPPGADDFLKTLKDERAVLAAVLKREEETGPVKTDAASLTPAVALIADDPPAPPQRPALAKKPSRPPMKTAGDGKTSASKASAPPSAPELQVDVTAPLLDGALAAAPLDDADSPVAAKGGGPIEGVRDFVVSAAQWSAQALPTRPFYVHALGLPDVGRLF